jgi:hypothetical protein
MDFVGSIVNPSNLERRRRIAGILLLACWVGSLAMPAIKTCYGGATSWGFGFAFLLIGWLGPLANQYEWFANPLFAIAVALLLAGKRPPIVLAAAAVLLAGLSVTFTTEYSDIEEPVCGHGPGFALWLAAIFGAAVFSVIDRLQSGPKPA